MTKINSNLYKIENENSFQRVIKISNEYKKNNPNKNIIALSIGDVINPIPNKVINKMKKALSIQKHKRTFKGYGSSSGCDFLKEKILNNEYKKMNFSIDEIYISDGTKSDIINILEMFEPKSKILLNDIMYPIYYNGTQCLNKRIYVSKLDEQLNFIPIIPKKHYDIIYLCSPNNPIGYALNKNQLTKWVNYAVKEKSIILYDNVYNTFIQDKNIPKSIYEIKGAKKVAIEFRSFSKSLSFSGIRCSYYIVPNEIYPDINKIWKERVINRFNGTNYITQVGAKEYYDNSVQKKVTKNMKYYLDNAKILKETFIKNNFMVWGGENSPYLWIKIKENITSWELFDLYLKKLNIIVTPGIIFGDSGNKYFRISSLANRGDILKAVERINKYYEKNN